MLSTHGSQKLGRLALHVSVWFACVVFFLHRDYRADTAAIQAGLDHIAQGYVPTIAEALREDNVEDLQSQLQGILRFQGVVYADVATSSGLDEAHIFLGDAEAPRDVVRKFPLLGNKQTPAARVAILWHAVLGRPHLESPIIQPCLGGGLWDGGASITAGDQHIANWLIGQVRNEHQSEERMTDYAREIGADENEFREAHGEVMTMLTSQFEQVCKVVFLFANQPSKMACQNMQQARAIYARESAEAELSRYRDHLDESVAQRTRELESAQGELLRMQRLGTLGQIIASVSHELRNPLGTMRSSMFMIKEQVTGKGLGVDRAVDRVERDILRRDAIIEELLDFTRFKKPDTRLAELDPWVAAALDELICPSHITLARNSSSGLTVTFDSATLRRALVNVINNAFQAMPAQGRREHRLSVETVGVADRVEIRVNDTRMGISTADRKRIFDPLFSTKDFGVGLGLSIVRQVMQRHGGDVGIESELGQGTNVTMWWPREGSGGASYEKEIAYSDRG